MTCKFSLAALAVASVLAISPTAYAVDEHNVSAGLTAAGAPLGLHGVDPAAFIEIGNRIDGRAQFATVTDGVTYYFASQQNLDAFTASPDAYLPQNGGFCTYGVSKGKKFDGNPKYAAVIDGKLYVFLNEEIFQLFQQDRAGTIAKAAENWQRIEHVAVAEL